MRDRETGVRRPIGPGDIGVLFRTRESHRLFEAALAKRGVPFYVYKGLGFFDADEVKDVLALLAYLADPGSNLRAAAFLRSRVVRLSDEALKLLAPGLAAALTGDAPAVDRVAAGRRSRAAAAGARIGRRVDRRRPISCRRRSSSIACWPSPPMPSRSAGPGFAQARENLKKIRGLVRRIQNRGYATLGAARRTTFAASSPAATNRTRSSTPSTP